MIKTKIGRAAGFGAAAIVAALGFATAVLAPTPAEARVFVGFGVGFPIGFPFYYPPYPYPPPAYYPPPPPYYPAPAAYPAPGTSKSAARRLCSLRTCGEPVDHLRAAARLDKRARSILPGIPDHRVRGQSYDRALRHRLPGCERPMEDC
jgi:hypothetical protein